VEIYKKYRAEANATIKSLKAMKKKGMSQKTMSIEGLISYCNKLLELCNTIEKLSE